MESTTTASDNTRDNYIVAAFMALLVGSAALVLGLR
jgi:hypothetical protein